MGVGDWGGDNAAPVTGVVGRLFVALRLSSRYGPSSRGVGTVRAGNSR
jgi:hypothetical protein